MNFYAAIGITERIDLNYGVHSALLAIKVEKPTSCPSDEYYEIINVMIQLKKFAQELNQLKLGAIVGIKGYLSTKNNNTSVIAERIQIS
jgi:hypothetical protein